jgi:large subunit ribosomal protein L9
VKVILTQTVERLGKAGDCVNVKDGFARNYLFPKNMAKDATPGNIKALESLKKKQAIEDANRLQCAKDLSGKIQGLSITISAKAGEEEKLFGAVTAEMISKALEAEGISIDKKEIVIDEPIKRLGVYQVDVKVHPEVKANLRVWIVKE